MEKRLLIIPAADPTAAVLAAAPISDITRDIPTLINIIWPALLANKNNLLLYIIEIICIII